MALNHHFSLTYKLQNMHFQRQYAFGYLIIAVLGNIRLISMELWFIVSKLRYDIQTKLCA